MSFTPNPAKMLALNSTTSPLNSGQNRHYSQNRYGIGQQFVRQGIVPIHQDKRGLT